MHVLVIGGTGFIGYHIVKQLVDEGKDVTLFCRSPQKAEKTFGESVKYIEGDLSFFRNINFYMISTHQYQIAEK